MEIREGQKKMEELISVIVPIYKTEKYLCKCVDSILNQTYRNLEIILVNDGSPDYSGEICDEYEKKDNRIKVIHQKNGGISVAMNNALDLSTGVYIATVDSDDYIHEKMIEVLYGNLKKFDADLSVCNIIDVYENETHHDEEYWSDEQKEQISIFNSKEALENIIGNQMCIEVAAWNKLYKKELFENLRFKEGKMYEDLFIIHRILDKASKIVYSNRPLYYYLIRYSSVTRQPFNLSRFDILEALEDRVNFIKEKGYNELYPKAYKGYMSTLMQFYHLFKKFYPNEKEMVKDLKNKIIYLYRNRGDVKFSELSDIQFGFFYINPSLHKMILKLYSFRENKIMDALRRVKENFIGGLKSIWRIS